MYVWAEVLVLGKICLVVMTWFYTDLYALYTFFCTSNSNKEQLKPIKSIIDLDYELFTGIKMRQ